MANDSEDIELDEFDKSIIAEAAARAGRHWKEILKEQLCLIRDGGAAKPTVSELGRKLQRLHEQCLKEGYGIESVEEALKEVRTNRGGSLA